jgi:hypothetical protein
VKLLGLALFLCLVGAAAVHAQTTPPDAPQNNAPEKKSVRDNFFSLSPPLSLAEDQRPMRTGEKFELFALNTVNPFQFVATAAWAGISQAQDSHPAWGQGAEGYGKRYAASYADTTSASFFGTFLFPSMFHHDPRYFRKLHGTFGQRLGYAMSRTVVTRTDHGRRAPNVSLWMGSLASGAISNLYYPDVDRGAGLTFERAGFNIATTAGFNLAREFWPDVARMFHHKKSPQN